MKRIKIDIKEIMASVVTVAVLVILFAIIFIKGKIIEPTPEFFVELGIVSFLMILIKLNWYEWAEMKRMKQDDIVQAKRDYDDIVDKDITDIYDFENFLKELNEENRQNYIKQKMGKRTRENCPNYDKLLEKYEKKAIRHVPEIKSCDVKTRGETVNLVDARNYQKAKKIYYEIFSTIGSIFCTIALAVLGVENISMNVANLFRYLSYVGSVVITMLMTIGRANRNTEIEVFDHLKRLQFIDDKYRNWKEGKTNGSNL